MGRRSSNNMNSTHSSRLSRVWRWCVNPNNQRKVERGLILCVFFWVMYWAACDPNQARPPSSALLRYVWDGVIDKMYDTRGADDVDNNNNNNNKVILDKVKKHAPFVEPLNATEILMREALMEPVIVRGEMRGKWKTKDPLRRYNGDNGMRSTASFKSENEKNNVPPFNGTLVPRFNLDRTPPKNKPHYSSLVNNIRRRLPPAVIRGVMHDRNPNFEEQFKRVMNIAEVESVEYFDQHFENSNYVVDVGATAESTYNWYKTGMLANMGSVNKLSPDALPPFHSRVSENINDDVHAWMNLCVTCDGDGNAPDTASSSPSLLFEDKRDTQFYWMGFPTMHEQITDARLVVYDPVTSFGVKTRVLPMKVTDLVTNVVLNDGETPFRFIPGYDAEGDDAGADGAAAAAPAEEQEPNGFGGFKGAESPCPRETCNTPMGWIAQPEEGSTTFDSTVQLRTANFFAGPNAGRVVIMVDDKYVMFVLAEQATIKLTGLETGTHNLTMSLFLRPGSPDPYVIARSSFKFINMTEERLTHCDEDIMSMYNPFVTSNLFSLRANQRRKVAPVLDILSPSINHKLLDSNYDVVFLFDFNCMDQDFDYSCGRRSLEEDFKVEIFLDEKLIIKNHTIDVGVLNSIPMPQNLEFGEHEISLLIFQTQFSGSGKSMSLPIIGNSTYFAKYDVATILRTIDKGIEDLRQDGQTSKDPWTRLEAVQRTLKDGNANNYVIFGTHVFTPQHLSLVTETYTKGGGSTIIYYNMAMYESAHWITNNLTPILIPEDTTLELVITIPENSTCMSDSNVQSTILRSNEAPHNIANVYRPLEKNSCGVGHYGDIIIPLSTYNGRIRLTGMGTGHFSFKFQMLDNRRQLVRQQINPHFASMISSWTTTVNNMTAQGVSYEGDMIMWEDSKETVKCWTLVQSGTVEEVSKKILTSLRCLSIPFPL